MRTQLAAAWLLILFLVVYLPDLGHGFIKDDFGWIVKSRVDSLNDVLRLFSSNVGFFRPLVSLSFSLEYSLWELDPFPYGLTNLGLFLVDAVLLWHLARALRLPDSIALVATAIWAFNFHGVSMSVLWISGRTALLMLVFALVAARTALSGRKYASGACSLLAMLCKEEAVLLPAFFLVFEWLDGRPRASSLLEGARRALSRAWPASLALVLYLILRLNSGAFWSQNAPSYYQFSFSPLLLLRNVTEYADREATLSAAAILVLWLFARRVRVTWNADETRAATFGCVWCLSFNALIVFLPIRSDLYALAPSVGIVLIAGAAASAFRRANPDRFVSWSAALLVASVLALPVYWMRNDRWVSAADLSARTLQTLRLSTTGLPGGEIVLVDDPSVRSNLDGSFANLLPEAILLTLGPSWSGTITTSPNGSAAADHAVDSRIIFALQNGRLVPARSD